MRTTLTLDDDLAMALHEQARATGQPFRAVVTEALRRGLAPTSSERTPVALTTHALGRSAADDVTAGGLALDVEVERYLRVTRDLEDPGGRDRP